MKRVLIAGAGYLGKGVADRFFGAGWDVTVLTRTLPESQENPSPYPLLAGDISQAKSFRDAGEKQDLVINCVSSGGGGAEAYRAGYLEGTRNLLDCLDPQRLIFVSSTSVYAQTDGSVVDESSPAEPDRETGKILRASEDLVLNRHGIVARLGAIYGRDRSVLMRKFFAGDARIEGDGLRWINQIHREDAIEALLFLAGAPGGIYNVTDSTPLAQRDIYEGLAARFSRPLPPGAPEDRNKRRGWSHKAVSNAKLRSLGWEPLYPSFFDALDSGAVGK